MQAQVEARSCTRSERSDVEGIRDGPGQAAGGLTEPCASGTYRAQPSRRAYIPKADGRQRSLGIAALEDKIVQHAVGAVLNQIYEEDFLGFPMDSGQDAANMMHWMRYGLGS